MESEKRIFELWERRRIYEKVKEKNRGRRKFYFVDGPPYATGSIHMGTAWNKILKDLYLRFFRMKGRDVWDQPGYDTHGLPIENRVEKELGLMRKNDIERFGVGRFVKECRRFATKYIDVMNREFANLGVWMDWNNPYLTLENDYIQGGWATFKEAHRKGFLYRGLYPVHVCPRCETAVAYNEIEYERVKDPSIYVKFRVRDKEYLLIFTTTPWTLPANTGVMAHPEKYYVKVRAGDEYYILAEERVEEVMELGGVEEYEVVERFKGKKLEGLRYEPVLEFDFQKGLSNGFRVVMSERFVSTEEGTGLVHTAPGHGKEDYQVGRENGLPVVSPVRINGTFDERVGKYSGKFVKAADREIMNELRERGLLFHSGELFHDYPHCWRCDSPLLLISVEQWFLGITKIRERLIEENQRVNWVPEFAKQRFHNWLNSLGDWPVSRQRYWGIPLPIWECESCGEIRVIGSVEELPEKPKDLHRPYIDKVTLKCRCGGVMRRVKDVMDVWFDSGLASWASLGYPKKNELFKRLWPADLNIEGPDQIRGWWNSQMIMSVLTFDRRPFENVVYHGFVLDAHGNKMSKSKGNIISPEEVIERYGRDVLRFYLLSKPSWEDFYFSWNEVEEIYRFFEILRNSFNFYIRYVRDVKGKPELEVEDRWILSRLNSTLREVERGYSTFNAYLSATRIREFVVEDLSRWYIKLIRERAWPTYEGKDKEAVFYTLSEIMRKLSMMIAPIAPFIAEEIYQKVGEKESVFLEDWPKPARVERKLEREMELVRRVVEAGNALRQEKGIGLRYPVKRIMVSGNEEVLKAVKKMEGVIRRIFNVKEVEIGEVESQYEVKPNYRVVGPRLGERVKELEELLNKSDHTDLVKRLRKNKEVRVGDFRLMEEDLDIREVTPEQISGRAFKGGVVYIDTEATPEIFEESLVREVVREVQKLRKAKGLQVEQRIELKIDTDEDTKMIIRKWEEFLKREVGAVRVEFGLREVSARAEFSGKVVDIDIEVV